MHYRARISLHFTRKLIILLYGKAIAFQDTPYQAKIRLIANCPSLYEMELHKRIYHHNITHITDKLLSELQEKMLENSVLPSAWE